MACLKVNIFGDGDPRAVSSEKPYLSVGAGSSCDVRCDAPDVAEEHLRVWVEGGHLWAQALAENTLMNEAPLRVLRPVLFHTADTFRLAGAPNSFSFEVLNSQEASRAAEIPTKPAASAFSVSSELERENRRLNRELMDLQSQMKTKNRSGTDDEEEVSQIRHDALREIRTTRETEIRRFDTWKRESVEDIEKNVLNLLKGEPPSSMKELQRCVSYALRKVLLGEKSSPPAKVRTPKAWSAEKWVLPLLLAAFACAAYAFHSRHLRREPASVLYIPSEGSTQWAHRSKVFGNKSQKP